MTEADAFLRAIIENPADDVPRLVFADWLDEHGQGMRAEYIRLACELAKGPDHPAKAELKRRIRNIEDRTNWIDVLLGMPRTGWCYGFKATRGFVSGLMCKTRDWKRHADEVLAVTPLEEVTFLDWPSLVVEYYGPAIDQPDTDDARQVGSFSLEEWPANHVVLHNTAPPYLVVYPLLHQLWPRLRFTFPDPPLQHREPGPPHVTVSSHHDTVESPGHE